jgi:hypothetical protein
MRYFSFSCALVFVLLNSPRVSGQSLTFPVVTKKEKVTIVYDKNGPDLDSISANLLALDIERITSYRPAVVTKLSKVKGNVIIIGSVESALVKTVIERSPVYERLKGKWECFGYHVVDRPSARTSKALVIAGSDARGTAYGVFTLSEKLGVSPWYWWADVPVKKQEELIIDRADFVSQTPSVKFRGIFINDEDWGLRPWAARTFEPEKNNIGPRTYAKVFELLLRLKANLLWPAMHPGTEPFFNDPENVRMANMFHVVIGTSHAEPMLRNNVGEWNEKTTGHFNYLSNKENVHKYWEERVRQSKGHEVVYTLGMRGVHDSGMEGVKGPREAVPLLDRIIADQRALLGKHIGSTIENIPQAFTAYKEVLDIYDNGLKLEDDITIVWPDDNYGYIQRLNSSAESGRRGGSGVYYHASYWGRPHDYLWLSSTHPSLIAGEMVKAYENGSDSMWVLNVGDIKPLEYNVDLFMDMAYHVTPFMDPSFTKQHFLNWISSIFGAAHAEKIHLLLWEYYQLAFERRPEFMGWSQTEPTTETSRTEFNHFFYGDEAQRRIDRYEAIERDAKLLKKEVDAAYEAPFYQIVYYPIVAASLMNKKFLYLDKHVYYTQQGRLSASDYAEMSQAVYDSIVAETKYFNEQLAGGKWKHMMSMKPRDLPAFHAPVTSATGNEENKGWSLAPEGFVSKDSSLLYETGAMKLPAFDEINRQTYFIDIFLTGAESVEWTASVSDPRIRLSDRRGVLTPEFGRKQKRIFVSVDWEKYSGPFTGTITFRVGEKTRAVDVIGIELPAVPTDFRGFIENNGYIAIHAAHYNHVVNKGPGDWKQLPDLGYPGEALRAGSVEPTDTTYLDDKEWIFEKGSYVEYHFYNLSEAEAKVTVSALPTHPLNKLFSVRCALSIDGGPLQIIDFRTYGRSPEWKQNVLRNRASKSINIGALNKGAHRLRVYSIDPGLVLQDILIDLGGLKKSYSVIAETKVVR